MKHHCHTQHLGEGSASEAAVGGKMELVYAGLYLVLFFVASSYQFRSGSGYGRFVDDPELEWERMEKVIGEEMAYEVPAPETKFWRSASGGSSTPEAKKVPAYMIVPASKVQKEVFKPEKGARPLPNSVKEMLLAASTAVTAATARTKLIEILCHVDRMYVRIQRDIFKTRDAYKYLKLGTCPVNQGNKEHYYLLYLLTTDCGFKKEVGKGFFVFNKYNFVLYVDKQQLTQMYVPEYC